MEKVIGGQGTGKTKALIEIAHKENAVIVCETPDRMIGKIHGYAYIGIECISYEDYIKLRTEDKVSTGKKYVVDDDNGIVSIVE